jgi:hypothetical protein
VKMSLYPDRSIIPRGDFFSLSTFHFHVGYSVFTFGSLLLGHFLVRYTLLCFIRVLWTLLFSLDQFLPDISVPFASLSAYVLLLHCILFGSLFSADLFCLTFRLPQGLS